MDNTNRMKQPNAIGRNRGRRHRKANCFPSKTRIFLFPSKRKFFVRNSSGQTIEAPDRYNSRHFLESISSKADCEKNNSSPVSTQVALHVKDCTTEKKRQRLAVLTRQTAFLLPHNPSHKIEQHKYKYKWKPTTTTCVSQQVK